MNTNKKIYKTLLNKRELIFETGELAKQADGSVLMRYGDSVVLVTAQMSANESNLDFFPLTVTFQEKLYSVGKIPGGFLKREGKPSDYGILSARLIDRALRPLFPEGMRNEVQIIINVLSVGNNDDVRVVALIASSLSLMISSIPFNGPVSASTATLIDDNIIVNPNEAEILKGNMELFIAGTVDSINMVEAGCLEVEENLVLSGITACQEEIFKINEWQQLITKEVGKSKRSVNLYTIDPRLSSLLIDKYSNLIAGSFKLENKSLVNQQLSDLKAQAIKYIIDNNDSDVTEEELTKKTEEAFELEVKKYVRHMIINEKTRTDGRSYDEIRSLSSRIDVLPIVHGSGLFTRGETQVLSVVTLGAVGENQQIDGISREESKRFMHHYNFPPFSVGEVRRMGPPSRREIGHGALGEKALEAIIPSEDVFPYTIRIVSEVLESNGSSSQASICSSVLALMAAGVPIKSCLTGIAMGLIKENDDYAILTDIQGLEDHLGDMDFKVAGTEKGICALQMDIKISGISREVLKEALFKARAARLEVMKNIKSTIAKPRTELAATAPKLKTIQIPVDKIRIVIGPSGKMINNIIQECNNVKIDISEEGRVTIYHNDYKAIEKAFAMVNDLVSDFEVGQVINGEVAQIKEFGAFVNLKKNTDGLIHISKLSDKRVAKVEDVINIGDKVKVKIIDYNDKNKRIKLELIEIIEKKIKN